MSGKRVPFREEERNRVKELVLARKDVVGSRKSDIATLSEKKKAWIEITEEYNSCCEFPKRTTVQLKKLWENVKFRRKMQLKKRNINLTNTDAYELGPSGSAPPTERLPVEAILETVASIKTEEDANDEITSSVNHSERRSTVDQATQVTTTSPRKGKNDILRLEIADEILLNPRELHRLKKEELQRRIGLIEREILGKAQLLELQKNKLLLEIRHIEQRYKEEAEVFQLEKKKLLLQIKNLED